MFFKKIEKVKETDLSANDIEAKIKKMIVGNTYRLGKTNFQEHFIGEDLLEKVKKVINDYD